MAKVIRELGSPLDKSKGASETLVAIYNQLKAGHELVRVEQREVLSGFDKGRVYDFVSKKSGKEIKYEVKAWKPEALRDFLFLSFKGKKVEQDEEAIKDLSQLKADLALAIKESFSGGKLGDVKKISVRWIFDARVGTTISKDEIIDSFINKLQTDNSAFRAFLKSLGEPELYSQLVEALSRENIRKFFNKDLRSILEHMIEINQAI